MLFIAIDDLNDWVGCLGGHPDVKTPNLDRLAQRGVLFTRAYCAAPACCPSRTALLTGLRPSTTGVYDNEDHGWRDIPMLKDAVTLPQYFSANGYQALGSGKIFHYIDKKSWDTFWPMSRLQRPKDPEQKELGPGMTKPFQWGALPVEDEAMGDWQVTDWVVKQLQSQHDRPFFLACGIYRPHLPLTVPQKYFDLYPIDKITMPKVKENDMDDIPQAGRNMSKTFIHKRITDANAWKQAVQAYLASVSFADACVGKVIDALDASPYRDNTVIVLWSDHGWHLGEKLHWTKFALWEKATRNILLFVLPGVTSPDGRCDSPVNLMDIYPTLVEACGLDPKAGLEGSSLLPLLKDPQAPWDKPSLSTYKFNNHSVRSHRFRYIRYADGSEELYDHDKDELEWDNLASNPAYNAVKAELRQHLPKNNAPAVERGDSTGND